MSKRIAAVLAAMVVFAACGDDPVNTGDTMTQAEAQLILNVFTEQGDDATAGESNPSTASGEVAIASVPVPFSRTDNISFPCPAGGSVTLSYTVTGSFDNQVDTWEIDLDGRQTHQSCAFTREGGVTITVNGNPNIEFAAHASETNGQPAEPHTLDIEGSFRWSASDGRSGTCLVDISAVNNFTQMSRTINASVCGHIFNQTLDLN